ncbi:MAG: response regulator transcription factor [Bacteroidales bacterium]|nr:response regulator transcription factor [Bacteroidales bacterium]
MNCMIVDDEPPAQDVIEEFVSKVPFLQLIARCSSAFEAIEVMEKNQIDLIFLDIHMPNASGIDFLQSLIQKPLFIFTTAYSEHALEGFNLNAVDYLLKPIPFDRFLKAVMKARDLYNIRKRVDPFLTTDQKKFFEDKEFLYIRCDYQLIKIRLVDIQYIEGLKDYVKIYTSNPKPYITLISLKMLSEKLPGDIFFRVHRSFIISVLYLRTLTKNRILISSKWIPVSENYREDFFNGLKKKGIIPE